jgi:hypothetical protein
MRILNYLDSVLVWWRVLGLTSSLHCRPCSLPGAPEQQAHLKDFNHYFRDEDKWSNIL